MEKRTTVPFTKMQGLGNDFMVIDGINNKLELGTEQIRRLADRHFGIGFDQLLLVEAPGSAEVDFNYRIFNGDGEEVEHCGNGARCFANFVTDKGLTDQNPIRVQTVNRVLTLFREGDGSVTVDMARPEFEPAAIPFTTPARSAQYVREIDLGHSRVQVQFCALSLGNPHAVIFVEDLDKTAVKDIGEALGRHPDFPEGVNVGFAQILGPGEINLRVYERGAGETLACGTGACAAVVAGCLLGSLSDTVKVNVRGGQLSICWMGEGSSVTMTGPAETVYEGTIEI